MEDSILQNKTVVELRALARQSGVKLPAGTNKARIIELLNAADKVAAPHSDEPVSASAKSEREAADKPARGSAAVKTGAAPAESVVVPIKLEPEMIAEPARKSDAVKTDSAQAAPQSVDQPRGGIRRAQLGVVRAGIAPPVSRLRRIVVRVEALRTLLALYIAVRAKALFGLRSIVGIIVIASIALLGLKIAVRAEVHFTLTAVLRIGSCPCPLSRAMIIAPGGVLARRGRFRIDAETIRRLNALRTANRPLICAGCRHFLHGSELRRLFRLRRHSLRGSRLFLMRLRCALHRNRLFRLRRFARAFDAALIAVLAS